MSTSVAVCPGSRRSTTCAPGAPRTWNHTSWSEPSFSDTASLPLLFLPTRMSLPPGATYVRTFAIVSSLRRFRFFGAVPPPPLPPLPPLPPPLFRFSSRLIAAAAPRPTGAMSFASTSSRFISSSASASSLVSSVSANSTFSRYAISFDAASRRGSTCVAVRRCFRAFLYNFSAASSGPFCGSTATRRASPDSKSYTSIVSWPCVHPCWYAMSSSA
mmetsp:Transcript_3365/g.11327  ORF Transcript_3365/g.11327 Transcript_3365/m.11327 type:complete len:216 (-) Transcript_3365:1928-2575(-)